LSSFIILFIPEVGEGNDQEAEKGVDRVEGVVDYLQCLGYAVDLVLGGPVLPATMSGAGRARDECHIDG